MYENGFTANGLSVATLVLNVCPNAKLSRNEAKLEIRHQEFYLNKSGDIHAGLCRNNSEVKSRDYHRIPAGSMSMTFCVIDTIVQTSVHTVCIKHMLYILFIDNTAHLFYCS